MHTHPHTNISRDDFYIFCLFVWRFLRLLLDVSDSEQAPGTDHQGRQMFLSNGGECVFRSKQPYRNKTNCLERNASVYGGLVKPRIWMSSPLDKTMSKSEVCDSNQMLCSRISKQESVCLPRKNVEMSRLLSNPGPGRPFAPKHTIFIHPAVYEK